MRISDWSSDVCSSDLVDHQHLAEGGKGGRAAEVREIVDDRVPDRPRAAEGNREVQDEIEHRVRERLVPVTGSSKRRSPRSIWHPSSCREGTARSEEHTSELQSLMRISYAVFCLKKKTLKQSTRQNNTRD